MVRRSILGMEYVAVRDTGYRIVLRYRDPAVEVPIGSHLVEAGPLAKKHTTHVMRVLDGPAAGAELHFICNGAYPGETPETDDVCPAGWLVPANGEARLSAAAPQAAVEPLLADAEAPLATRWNADAPPDARGHWLTGSFIAGLVRRGDIDPGFHLSYYPTPRMIAAWHDDGLAMVVLCDAERASAREREINVEAITTIFSSRTEAEVFAKRLGGWPDGEIIVERADDNLWLVTAVWWD